MTPDHMGAQDFVNEFVWIWTRHEGRLSVAARIFGMSPEALAQRLYRAKRTGIKVSFYNDINAAGAK